MEFLNEHQKGTVFFSLLHKYTFCDSLLCQTTKFCTLARKSIFPARTIICRTYVIIANDMAVPRSFSVHMINKCVLEKKDRKTWAFRRRTVFCLLITRFIYIRALIARQITYKNRSSKTSVVGTVNLWRTRAWRKKYIKFRRKKIEVRSSLLRPFSPGESKSKISLSFCRFFSFSFLRWSIKSNCILHFQFLAENPLVPTLRTLPQWNSLTNSNYSCGRTSRFENANT